MCGSFLVHFFTLVVVFFILFYVSVGGRKRAAGEESIYTEAFFEHFVCKTKQKGGRGEDTETELPLSIGSRWFALVELDPLTCLELTRDRIWS